MPYTNAGLFTLLKDSDIPKNQDEEHSRNDI